MYFLVVYNSIYNYIKIILVEVNNNKLVLENNNKLT